MKLSKLTVLSEQEIKEIHNASLDILETCGVKILNKHMLKFLEEQGLPVNRENQTVRFPRSIIEDILTHIPSQFEVFDRDGKIAFVIGDGISRIAAGHNAVFWVDSETGETRPSTVADVKLFARICEHLPAIDMIGIPVMPQDVPNPEASLLYGVKAVIENSRKPIFFSTDKSAINDACIELIKTAFNGNLKSKVYGISQLSPTSPLFWEGGVIDSILNMVNTGVPIAILPEPNAGVSSPYTLAGLLTINNAECLSGIAMIQMLQPGTKVMYANSWTVTDMRSGAALVGSTETTICRIAGAQLARFYKIPSHTTAPNSDNHAHDEQNSWEKTFSAFCSVAAGNDLLVNCGMFATGLTCSNEQLIMDEEISAMSKRIAEGIKVNEDTIAKDLIKKVGPKGKPYLTEEHTLRWLRSDEYFMPQLAVRGPRASWEAAGAKDTYQLTRDKTKKYAGCPVSILDEKRQEKLDEIINNFSFKKES